VEQLATNGNKRLLRVTTGNISHSHLYVRGLYDFFPKDCIGPSRKSQNGSSPQIEIVLDGLNETIQTDIGTDPRSGKPRGHFRGRTWVRRFFEHHRIAAGDQLAIERLGLRRYRLSPAESASTNGERGPKAAEFFAGIGLVRLALERQGWQVVFANDIDPDKAEMYRHNWPQSDDLVVEDIHKLKAKDIPDCDLYTASFPCNDLSIAGRWDGLNGKESSAFWGLIELLRTKGSKRPRLVLLENVLGFLMRNRGQDLEQALLALNKLGYAVDVVVLNAVHWVPQSRVRLFVVGKRVEADDRQTFAMASPVRPATLVDFIAGHPHIAWDLADLPSLPQPKRRLSDIVEDLANDDPHWWNAERTRYFFSQLSSRHKRDAERMIEGRTFTYATAFRRVRHGKSMAELRTDGIAGCLRTPRGGSGRQILFKAGKGRYQVRLLTARECARLQGVPDNYVIDVPLNKALFGFGDAVCVPAIEWIAKHYLSTLWYVKSVD
jgi:DNA (cytosine-5)-methyltransferase 1